MNKHPAQHTIACKDTMMARRSQRPKNRCVMLRFLTDSSSTSMRIITISMNTPIHNVRLMNKGAIAEP